MEAKRHRWLSLLVERGYSARMFALTGLVLVALGVILAVWVVNGGR